MNILLSRKDKILIGIAVVLYLVAIFVRLSLIGHLIVFAFFLKLLQKIFKDKQTPTYRIIMLIVILSIFILIRIYNIYQIVSGWNNDIGRSSQIIKPSISLPPKKEMKSSLILALSATPLPKSDIAFPKLKVELPPVGPYCNGCYSGPPGGYAISSTKEILVADGQWISGGRLTQTGGEKWNYIYYVFKRLLPEIPQDSGMVMPGGAFLKDAIKLKVNGSQGFEMNPTKV